MRRLFSMAGGVILGALSLLPGLAAGFHPMVIRPAASFTARSSASHLTARANANAGYAAGIPYVNPNIGAYRRSSQAHASANANAAEIQEGHVGVGPP